MWKTPTLVRDAWNPFDIYAPMNQAFVMEAISRYAKEVKQNTQAIRDGMKHSFINPNAWIACAHDWENIKPVFPSAQKRVD